MVLQKALVKCQKSVCTISDPTSLVIRQGLSEGTAECERPSQFLYLSVLYNPV